jgi:tetratricopeptide (TPR) repeat protein
LLFGACDLDFLIISDCNKLMKTICTYSRITLLLLAFFLSACSSIPTESPPALVGVEVEVLTDSENPDEMIETAKRYCNYSAPLPKQLGAFKLAQRAYLLDRSNRDAAFTLARSALFISGLIEDDDIKWEIIRKGFEGAVRAGGEEDDPAAAYYLGALMGLLIEEEGLTAAGEVPRFQEAMERAEKKPETDMGGPLRALGMLYLRAPAWPAGVGDLELALEFLEKAGREYPDHPENHLFFAYALEEDDQIPEAREALRSAEESISTGQWGEYALRWQKEIDHFRKEMEK